MLLSHTWIAICQIIMTHQVEKRDLLNIYIHLYIYTHVHIYVNVNVLASAKFARRFKIFFLYINVICHIFEADPLGYYVSMMTFMG